MEVKAYGLDYSAGELSPRQIDDYNRANPDRPISFLVRYIGYPNRRKCISYYPGALASHEAAGRPVLLVHQDAYQDFADGEDAGRAHGLLSVLDAERAGWRWDRPIFAAFDRWLNSHDPARGIYPISLDTVRDYMRGFRSVLGDHAGLYGFGDVMGPCVAEDWVRWRWQCGAETAVVQGVQLYQSNRGYVYPGGIQSDLNLSYVDIEQFGGDDVGNVDSISKAALEQIRDELMYYFRPVGYNPATGEVETSKYNFNDFIWWGNQMQEEAVTRLRAQAAELVALREALAQVTANGGITPQELEQALTAALRNGGATVELELKPAPAPTQIVRHADGSSSVAAVTE